MLIRNDAFHWLHWSSLHLFNTIDKLPEWQIQMQIQMKFFVYFLYLPTHLCKFYRHNIYYIPLSEFKQLVILTNFFLKIYNDM